MHACIRLPSWLQEAQQRAHAAACTHLLGGDLGGEAGGDLAGLSNARRGCGSGQGKATAQAGVHPHSATRADAGSAAKCIHATVNVCMHQQVAPKPLQALFSSQHS